jgi:hypothetical protein
VDAQDILQLVFQHLSSSDEATTTASKYWEPTANQQLALAAARYVHRVSRSCQETARRAIIQVDLRPVTLSDNFWTAGSSSPWALLGAARGLRSLKLRTDQSQAVVGSHFSCFQGLAAHLTQLDLEVDDTGGSELSQVLASCTGLKALRLRRGKRCGYTKGSSPWTS